ncbi:ribosomal-protein-alanine N-acetyltransferase [Flavobacteriaceae bacterium UJ101]|nr:ribosomal-protein-alanine N-acetyltransferase [Flavobacteriaceae bacterium UJ101]
MIEFRNIKRVEIPIIQQLAHEIWNDNYQEMIGQEQIDYMLNMMYSTEKLNQEFDEDYIWKFIRLEGKPIGYISCRVEERDLFLSKIYLLTQYQGKGYSRKSLEYLIDFAPKINCNRIYLTVNKTNIKGIRAYERFGFERIDEKVMDIGNGYVMDDYIYEIRV